MPGLPLPQSLNQNIGCEYAYPGSTGQAFRQQLRTALSPDEKLTAEKDLALYCKPVELYNIIQRRAMKNPLFIQRCLLYNIHARRKKRIQITISLSGSTNTELQTHYVFPLYVLLARPTSNLSLEGHSPIYRFSRVCLLTSFSEHGNKDNSEATFIIPDVKSLSTSRACNHDIIFISCGQVGQSNGEDNCSGNHVEDSSLQMLEGKCSWGKIPTNLLASSLESCVNLSLGHIVELASKVTMRPSFLEPKFLEQDSCLTFCSHKVDAVGSYKLQLCMSAQEAGARDMSLSPYSSYSYNDVPPSSLSDIIRLRSGNVLFNYKYYNNTMQETEVTEDFSCPFCYVRCGSFKGLGCHLNSSHDLFHYEFWISEEYQVVNVSLKADAWRTELFAEGVDPRHQTFSYRSRFKKRRRSKNTMEKIRHVHSHIMESGSPEDEAGSEDNFVQGENGTSVANASIDPAQSLHGSNLSPPTVLQFGKTRKLSERSDPRNRQLLQKRQFFHSHRAQPMQLEQVFSDRDSEDEVDDDIADFEDRRMLDDFVDVTKDEKLIMHMWNSFVRKQRVLADGHIPWACEAFSQLHGRQLIQNPALLWGWRFFMIKLWNHNILDARTMNTCNTVLQILQEESTGLK
ncbi:VEF family protein [Zea mays]|uniref:Embryonic flower 2 n=1 Tax=Zea mays TaxID=4577 RepID=Q84UX5_MAIZE|nr:VEF family protein [Zea mays]AAO84022.1 VEF family protein [Zea mays]AAX35735.1 embryonic flower 2 [Zea mays]ONM54136.1 Embryonic flower 2 [Zea mays]|eukprot:NP_001105530.1 VEF family protein [Zea mays]